MAQDRRVESGSHVTRVGEVCSSESGSWRHPSGSGRIWQRLAARLLEVTFAVSPFEPSRQAPTDEGSQAVIADDALSFNAKNVKIITRDGHVTLRGPVNHQKERLAIGEIASRVAGPSHVDNQLEIKSK